ncbi:PD-(D/E)XK nuclease family protein [Myxococcus faecalis]|uniref:PD-(D/E)XK nuclease family protein n=1 Tax=Myxococcus faecalis TaxID=3115646 RepID=UPI003CE8C4E2
MPPPLPTPISTVTVPRYFSPSNWLLMERCPLRVWSGTEGPLPESIEAIVGSLLHHAREAVLTQGLTGVDHSRQVEECLIIHRDHYEARLRSDPGYAALIPIQEAIGRLRWLELTEELKSWARLAETPIKNSNSVGEKSPLRVKQKGGSAPNDVFPNSFSLGAEQWWTCNPLRLRGRADEARLTADGVIEVTDYKTGVSVDANGRLMPNIEMQMELYLLMAETLTSRPARGRVYGRKEVSVPWDLEKSKRLLVHLQEFTARFPVGKQLAADVAALPGTHCIGCRLRPSCKQYLERVPAWWENNGEHPRPLPFDVWGRITRHERAAQGWSVWLEDAAGRRVVLRGLADTHGIGSLPAGILLYAFNLEPTEDTYAHGRRIHPRSFHEWQPGPRWRCARQTRLFTERAVT